METERFLRQLDIVPFEKISTKSASVIGCGAIGRQLALQLAAIGVSKLQLIDNDTVEDHNRTTQGYRIKDLGSAKVDALKIAIEEMYDDVEIEIYDSIYPNKNIDLYENVFVAVDSIRARKNIWKNVKTQNFEFFCDCRMLAENMHVYALNRRDDEALKEYASTLFSEKDEDKGSCTARMTIYSASACASLASHQFTRHLRNWRVSPAKNFNMIAQFYSNIKEGFDVK